ncbi:HNH endonuclease signature motif containing protein [Flavobacterium algicola]|uniref:HNH endonuclease signature motif containing protein n=1 Tax=Flavobacterium algicola TaxID=556529 RepID=UPI001EFCEF8F|nr:HNH endonuclease signature motif containing protein [Flavobacterium algicola]MCG9792506.1 HNH endonuclease [Flavobacterium algicola]
MGTTWTPQENKILIEKYPDSLTTDLLALLPGRTISMITGHANVLGVKKSAAFYAAGGGGRMCKGSMIGIDTRFTPQTPGWNKGKKQVEWMSPEKIAQTAKTRFKKGQDPHNTQAIGYERMSKDGYIEVKFQHLKNGRSNNDNFEFKHRLIYQAENGPIPDGMIVEFKDGDKTNFDPSNLILKSRKENLLRNTMCDTSIVKRFMGIKDPEMVKEVIDNHQGLISVQRNIIKVKSKINESRRKIN